MYVVALFLRINSSSVHRRLALCMYIIYIYIFYVILDIHTQVRSSIFCAKNGADMPYILPGAGFIRKLSDTFIFFVHVETIDCS